MFSKKSMQRAALLLKRARKKSLKIATAESCTGGLVAALLTSIPGSSDVFERGFVTYSNAAKTEMLGVPASLIKKYGAVSAEVAGAMAKGALKRSRADIAVSVTGVAGPGGGTKQKPVGLVYMAIAAGKKVKNRERRFTGSRNSIRQQALLEMLAILDEAVSA